MEEPLSTVVVAPAPGLDTQLIGDAVKRIVDEILSRERTTLLDLYLFVGGKVIRELFAGSLEEWNKRNVGDRSMQQLAEMLEANGSMWSSMRLYRAVRIYEQFDTFTNFDRWPHLTVSHLVAVHGLRWYEQKPLLDQAEQQRLSVAALTSAVTRFRIRKAESEAVAEARPMPPPVPPEKLASAEAARTLSRIERALELRDELAADLAAAGDEGGAIAELQSALEAADARVHAAMERMKAARRR